MNDVTGRAVKIGDRVTTTDWLTGLRKTSRNLVIGEVVAFSKTGKSAYVQYQNPDDPTSFITSRKLEKQITLVGIDKRELLKELSDMRDKVYKIWSETRTAVSLENYQALEKATIVIENFKFLKQMYP